MSKKVNFRPPTRKRGVPPKFVKNVKFDDFGPLRGVRGGLGGSAPPDYRYLGPPGPPPGAPPGPPRNVKF